MKINKNRFLLGIPLGMAAIVPFSSATAGDVEVLDKNPISDAKVVVDGEYEDDEEYPVDENLWLYTKGTKTREQGSFELKTGGIARLGKREGSYTFLDLRPELEYGITDKLTVGASFFVFHHDYDNVPWAPMVDTQGGPGGSYDNTQIGGWEGFLKYNLFNPFEDWMGVSLGISYDRRRAYRLDGARITQDAVSPILYLQKSFLDDRLQWAFKGKLEHEHRVSPGVLEEEIAPDLATGLSYGLTDELWIGVEARWQSDFLTPEEDGEIAPGANRSSWDWGDYKWGDQFQWGLYVGPTIHWDPEDTEWWVTGGALWQVKGWSADGADASSGGKNWDEHEQVHVGILFGYEWGD